MNAVRSILFLSLATILFSCQNGGKSSGSADNTSQQSMDLEKQKLELEREKLKLKEEQLAVEKNAFTEKQNKEQAVKEALRQQKFQSGSECVVISSKAFFYNSPNYSTKRKAYLVKGDSFYPRDYKNGFVYVDFYSPELNKSTIGWVSVNDIEPIQ